MKKIMIVDDEILVRTGIKALIDWENHGYEVVCEAKDGREAREKIHQYRPDIVLTDLKMEPEDGMELIRYCKKEWPRIKIIVLSNYNDFENVRNAMKLGASDYVFKLMVKSEELLKILDEVGKDLEKIEDIYEESSRKNTEDIKEEILKMVEGDKQLQEEELKELFSNIHSSIDLRHKYKVIRLWVDNIKIMKEKEDFSKHSAMTRTIENTIREIISRSFPVEIFREGVGEFIAIINIGEQKEECLRKEKDVASTLLQYLFRYCGIYISMGVSGVKWGIGFLQEALQETEEIKETCFLRKRERFLEKQRKIQPFEVPEKFQIESLKRLVDQGNLKEMMERWEQFFLFLENHRDMDSSGIHSHLKKMYILLSFMFQNRQTDTETVTDRNGVTIEEALNGYDKLEDLKTSVYELLKKIRELEQSCKSGKAREEVEVVKDYVKTHLQEDISAAFAAEMANMSVSHFSHVFKENTGMAFGEYVIQKRMDRAAKLLEETDLKINEVADAVGIDNPNYFSTRFKKAFQVSPSDYKKR